MAQFTILAIESPEKIHSSKLGLALYSAEVDAVYSGVKPLESGRLYTVVCEGKLLQPQIDSIVAIFDSPSVTVDYPRKLPDRIKRIKKSRGK